MDLRNLLVKACNGFEMRLSLGLKKSELLSGWMELSEFTALVSNFSSLAQTDQILHFAWYLHTFRNKETVDQAAVRGCFKERHMDEPNLSLLFKRIIDRRPKVVLASGSGFRLESKIREQFDKEYGQHETTIAVTQMMKDLIGKVSDQGEKVFLAEAVKCYNVKAFRAAIVMAWNLGYDHLLYWVLADAGRLSAFNSKIIAKIGPKRGTGLTIVKREDFEELKESEVLDICSNAGLFGTKNTKRLLEIELTKRNMAAHPSTVVIGGPAADEAISSLVENVVLFLK